MISYQSSPSTWVNLGQPGSTWVNLASPDPVVLAPHGALQGLRRSAVLPDPRNWLEYIANPQKKHRKNIGNIRWFPVKNILAHHGGDFKIYISLGDLRANLGIHIAPWWAHIRARFLDVPIQFYGSKKNHLTKQHHIFVVKNRLPPKIHGKKHNVHTTYLGLSVDIPIH